MALIQIDHTKHCRNNFVLACGLLALALSWCWFCPGRADYASKPRPAYPIAAQETKSADADGAAFMWTTLFLAKQK